MQNKPYILGLSLDLSFFCVPPPLRDLEEDPLFGDDPSADGRLSGSDWLSPSPSQSPDHGKTDGKTEVHKIVNRSVHTQSHTYIYTDTHTHRDL